ncbi:hypothetical protein B0A55_04131 [Friedmanniomyces simplex]|uniref:Uncharacterized protein n=1 Tax=Friedmanniomyces simplex TaxID=329884 RepID=A0A4U0XQS0_9PEZI|nr:hypothetical protein B0A55_04131 [Friedmanniomyces simplex]
MAPSKKSKTEKAPSATSKGKRSAAPAKTKPAGVTKPKKPSACGKRAGKPSKSTNSSPQVEKVGGIDWDQTAAPAPENDTEMLEHWCEAAQIELHIAEMERRRAEAFRKYAEATNRLLEVIARNALAMLRSGKLDTLRAILESALAEARDVEME